MLNENILSNGDDIIAIFRQNPCKFVCVILFLIPYAIFFFKKMIVESNHEGRFLRDFVKLRWRDITVCKELVMQAQRSESKLYNAYKTV